MAKRCVAGLVAMILLAAVATAKARDFFLTIGGGGSATGNQVSLEKNVLYFQRVLQGLGLADARHDIFFSDGNDPARDLQFFDRALPIPEANRLLAELCGQEDGIEDQYRTHQVPGVRGPATRAEIELWFEQRRDELKAGDRLLIYFTGHGGKGSNQQGNHVHLWNGEKLTVAELVAQLDRLPPEVAVTIVMVQCYSGGFADVIFKEATPDKGASPARRCGFFATTHDRVAAGCTPDIDEENYQEYSSYFWAALSGHKRLGEGIEKPDYDRDGHVSFEEAHAYALLESETIDISQRTSDAFLRANSKTKADDRNDLLTPDSPREALLDAASPIDRAVFTGLIDRLGLGEAGVAAGRELLEKVKKEKDEIEKEKGKTRGEFKKLAAEILKALKTRWPELGNAWHPRVQEILSVENLALVEAARTHARYSELARLHDELNRLQQQMLDSQRKIAKCQRLINIGERMALAANLPKLASAETQARYEELLTCERGTLEVNDAADGATHSAAPSE